MQGKYRKIMVRMNRETEEYRFWNRETAEPVCYVESYKDKRAVFFHGRNLLPGENYHLILIGSAADEMVHQDFGPLHTGGNGELQCYRTFGGAELECYTFCILCANKGDSRMDIIYKGMLFQKDKTLWEDLCRQSERCNVFSQSCDETGAEWFRVEDLTTLPPGGEVCLPWVSPYGHYIIGRKSDNYYMGVPGRFLQKEQPLREEGVFLLWQPLRGGEAYYERPDLMTKKQQEEIYGYWIAEVDIALRRLKAL